MAVRIGEEETARQRAFAKEVTAHPARPETYFVVTYGCQMNVRDSETIAGMLEEMGMTRAERREDAEFVIFNTCCVRDNAERRALGNVTWLKEIRKNHPRMMIAVCGCMAQREGFAEKMMRQYPFVDIVFGTSNAHELPEMVLNALESRGRVRKVDQTDYVVEGLPARRESPYSAFVNISYGCDNFCTYCIVPYVRGRERSREPGEILKEIEGLKKSGVKEIMLLGQNVNSYGKGLADNISFAELLRMADKTGMERIRFMSSHPKDLSEELMEVMAGSRNILPQFHLPVQSGNDEILKRMNRHYTREEYLEKVRKLREYVPGIGISTDIIVAFPGETESQFEDTAALVREARYISAFTFIYSPREGTRAAEFDGRVPEEIARERIERLIALQEGMQKEVFREYIGAEEEVLIESVSRRNAHQVSGKGRHGISITMDGNEKEIGQIVKCRVTEAKQNTLIGERI